MAVVTHSVWSSPAEPEALQPFRIRGGTRGCLLIHGFAGTPPEMRGLGEFLAARGYDVIGPLLAGHGLTPEAMTRATRARCACCIAMLGVPPCASRARCNWAGWWSGSCRS